MSTTASRASNMIKLVCGIVFTWAFAIGTSVPYMFLRYQVKFKGEYFCVSRTPLQQIAIHASTLTVIGWVIPIPIITILYVLCIRKLQENIFNNDNSDAMMRRIIENKRIITMFILLGTLFCFCTLPYAILNITINFLLAYKRNVDGEAIRTLYHSLFVLSSINSCINPLVYVTKQPDMKRFFKQVQRKLCLWCKAVRLGHRSDWQETYEIPPVYNRSVQLVKVTEIATTNNIEASSSQDRACKAIM